MRTVQEIVGAQLDAIAGAYPPARMASIRTRMEAFWNRESHRYIPRIVFGLPVRAMPELSGDATEDERELVAQLQGILEHAPWDDDFYPALFPGLRQVLIPSFFGCVEEFASASVRVKPAIGEPGDVYRLPDAGFGPGTVGGALLERMHRWRELTNGSLAFYEADMQGPFSVASQIWGVQEFLTALYDSPDEVCHLLDRCTDAAIAFIRLMKEAAGGPLIAYHCMPALWYPQRLGAAVSEDLAAVVSPAVVTTFMRPCLERIAAAFGGVFMHSCGSLNRVVGALGDVRGLVGLNFSPCETDLDSLLAAMDPRLFVVAHNSPVSCDGLPVLGPLEHARACGQLFRRHRAAGVCQIVPCGATLDPREHNRAIEEALAP